MADMHRPGRIGGDVFDVDLLAAARRCRGRSRRRREHGAQRRGPGRGLERQIDEARPRDLDLRRSADRRAACRRSLRRVRAASAGILGQHHRGIGRHVAMGGSRGGSTTMRDRSSPAGSTPCSVERVANACTRDETSAKRCGWVVGSVMKLREKLRRAVKFGPPNANRGSSQKSAGARQGRNGRSFRR